MFSWVKSSFVPQIGEAVLKLEKPSQSIHLGPPTLESLQSTM